MMINGILYRGDKEEHSALLKLRDELANEGHNFIDASFAVNDAIEAGATVENAREEALKILEQPKT